MRTGIYAILDIVADGILGGLYLHKHEAAAVRFFNDIAGDPQTMVARHPSDFNLIRLGFYSGEGGDHNIIPIQDGPGVAGGYEVILEGSAWEALNRPAPPDSSTLNMADRLKVG